VKKNAGYIIFVLLVIASYFTIVSARKIGFTEGYAPMQPINFSHKTHAGDNQIQCVYCHSAAQSGRHAGVPPTELCMNCHTNIKKDSPEVLKIVDALKSGKGIRWNKVNLFPDFAYFNHSQHVMIGKISCQQCHGEVQTYEVMKQKENLSMGWCISCHREKEIAPPSDHKKRSGGDCAKCHY
jgi:hypothetical protein